MSMAWVAYYTAACVVLAAFAAVVIVAIRKNWEGAVFVFGIGLLVVGCDLVKPDNRPPTVVAAPTK